MKHESTLSDKNTLSTVCRLGLFNHTAINSFARTALAAKTKMLAANKLNGFLLVCLFSNKFA